MNAYCLLLICLKGYSTSINSRLSKSVKYYVSSLFIVIKKNVTNITLILILCLNKRTSRLIRLRCRNFIRETTHTIKINKKRKEYNQILILNQESKNMKKTKN